MPVRWDLTGEKVNDALSEMEHLSFEVLHQSECRAHLETFARKHQRYMKNLLFFLSTVCWVRHSGRVVIKVARKCEWW